MSGTGVLCDIEEGKLCLNKIFNFVMITLNKKNISIGIKLFLPQLLRHFFSLSVSF